MNKISIYNVTYGRLDEIDRSQKARDSAFSAGQASYDAQTPNFIDIDPEDIYIRAAGEALEAAERDAMIGGYPDIDAYAMSEYDLQPTVTSDGRPYSPGEQLIDQNIEIYEEMIKRGEI
jgi:hypothetical protein